MGQPTPTSKTAPAMNDYLPLLVPTKMVCLASINNPFRTRSVKAWTSSTVTTKPAKTNSGIVSARKNLPLSLSFRRKLAAVSVDMLNEKS